MTTADDLRAARALIEEPATWTKLALARYCDGTSTAVPFRKNVVSRCVVGALSTVQHLHHSSGGGIFLTRAAKALGYQSASALNDAPETTHRDVLALFDLAIQIAEWER